MLQHCQSGQWSLRKHQECRDSDTQLQGWTHLPHHHTTSQTLKGSQPSEFRSQTPNSQWEPCKSLSDSDAKSKDKKGMEAGWNLGTESLVNKEVKSLGPATLQSPLVHQVTVGRVLAGS